MRAFTRTILCLAVGVLVASCAAPKGPSEASGPATAPSPMIVLLPPAGAVAGWKMDGEAREYPGRKLFDLIDGAGEIHMTYSFVTAGSADYVNDQDQYVTVRVFQLGTSADAYGLNSFYSPARGKPVTVGHDGKLLLGTCQFWKGPYYVEVIGDPLAALDPVAEALARWVDHRIGEEGSPPDLVRMLPPDGRETDPAVFLHLPLILSSLNFQAVVVDPEALGLNETTSMVVAQYEGGFALSVTRYPDEESVQPARQAYVNAEVYVADVGPYWVATTSGSAQAERVFKATLSRVRVDTGR